MDSKITLFLVFLFSTQVLWAGADTVEGYQGKAWGTPIKSFQSTWKSSTADFVDRLEAQAVDYLMMDFHEVDQDDAFRPKKFNVQRIHDDRVNHVFYDGRYRLAVVPISVDNEKAVHAELNSKYHSFKSRSYCDYWDFLAPYGWKMMRYDYEQYQKSRGTRVYLIYAFSFLEDGSIEDSLDVYSGQVIHETGPVNSVGGFLVYVSEDYFKSNDNAWSDYQANKKTKPKADDKAKEDRRRQDLGSVE